MQSPVQSNISVLSSLPLMLVSIYSLYHSSSFHQSSKLKITANSQKSLKFRNDKPLKPILSENSSLYLPVNLPENYQTEVIIAFTDKKYIDVAEIWLKRMKKLSYENVRLYCLEFMKNINFLSISSH